MLLFWDASALAKRYFAEEGSDTVNALFTNVPAANLATTPWGYAETYSILLRRRNGGILNETVFINAADQLRVEVMDSPAFGMLPIDSETVFASLSTMYKHNLNATDAAILTMLLVVLSSPPPSDFVLVAADQRLLRAAENEGIRTLDPALLSADDVPEFLATL